MEQELLTIFLALLCATFFVPKLLARFYIPPPVSEFALGIIAAMFFASHIPIDVVHVFSVIGVIMLFVSAGLDVDIPLVRAQKKMIAAELIAQCVVLAVVAFFFAQNYPVVTAILISLAMITPSAGFIISSLEKGMRDKNIISASAVSSELLTIGLLVFLLGWGNPLQIALEIVGIIAMIFLLPKILGLLYNAALSHLVDIEFPLFFVVALISGFVTDRLGLHFIVGAFIAGLVIRLFMEQLRNKHAMSNTKEEQILQGMNFFSLVFAPFYFFAVGTGITPSFFSWNAVLPAIALFAGISIIRFLTISSSRAVISKKWELEFRHAHALLPTLLITIVIAILLHDAGHIGERMFNVLLWYAVLTTLCAVAFTVLYQKKQKTLS